MMTLKPHPRTRNAWLRNDMPLVVKAPHLNGDSVPASVGTALDLLGGLERTIRPGDEVMIKPNLNCSYALPLSTELGFLAAMASS